MNKALLVTLAAAAIVAGCSSGGTGVQSSFALIEFLDSGKDQVPRNRVLTFQFSAPVAPGQDLPERLKIQNIQAGQGESDFSRAVGLYIVSGDVVVFQPRLPESPDRSDAGFREDGAYRVFLKGGADALHSTEGDAIGIQQEFLFDTNATFEDPDPTQPPRALSLIARDVSTGDTFDISRVDANPAFVASRDSSQLLAATDGAGLPAPRAIEPGAGGGPNFSTPWQFDLQLSEPVDPSTILTDNIELIEIRNDALDGATTANPGTFGAAVNFKVPISVTVLQRHDATTGALTIFIRVTPVQTLVDDARYRLTFSGSILGIDFSKEFIGENGLSGDNLTIAEPGGIGYVTEFLVYDRAAITATRTHRDLRSERRRHQPRDRQHDTRRGPVQRCAVQLCERTRRRTRRHRFLWRGRHGLLRVRRRGRYAGHRRRTQRCPRQPVHIEHCRRRPERHLQEHGGLPVVRIRDVRQC